MGEAYPFVKERVETIFGWKLKGSPTLILLGKGSSFERMAGSAYVIAFAAPEKNLIVMDWSKLKGNRIHAQDVLKHELCHLLIHQEITRVPVPRWLDEGLAQWASDGVMDIVSDQKGSRLNRAVFNDRMIPVRRLADGFPIRKDRLILAYEESKDFVEYIIGRYGKEGLLKMLRRMGQGQTVSEASQSTFSVPLASLEVGWKESLKRRVTWLSYLSYYLYEILFALGGLLMCFAAVKVFLRKRAYMRAEMENGDGRGESGWRN
ncbi:MAG: peptidase MA family metallohydrolase [Deltaproteobacteria bacterium]|nr:peptidase MA family metallohydrolase [Deltaproteobacteria bacterium]